MLAEYKANTTAPVATKIEVAIPNWIRIRFLLSPFFCCSRMALALARAASRCSDLVGLGVFEVILVVYRTIVGSGARAGMDSEGYLRCSSDFRW